MVEKTYESNRLHTKVAENGFVFRMKYRVFWGTFGHFRMCKLLIINVLLKHTKHTKEKQAV